MKTQIINKNNLIALTSALALTLAAQSSAHSANIFWNFDFTLSSGANGIGLFETASTEDAGNPDVYTILGIIGTLDGQTMTLLPVGNDGVVNSNDNLLYPFSPAFPNLDFKGFSFSANSVNYNIYSDSGSPTGYVEENSLTTPSTFPVTWTPVSVPVSVPESSTTLVLLSFVGLGAALKRKVRK